MIKEFKLIELLNELFFQPLFLSIFCFVAIYILYKNKLNLRELKRCFLVSFMVGITLKTGSYILVLPLLALITIIKLRKSKDREMTIKILIVIFLVYFFSIFNISFFDIKFYTKDMLLVKNYIIEFTIALVTIVLICNIINVFSRKKANFKEPSPTNIRRRMVLGLSIPIAVNIRLIYPFLDMRNGTDKLSFVIEKYIPLGIPLMSMILILIVIYNYDKSLKSELRLKREIEEKYRIEEYASMVEKMYSETRRFKHDYMNMLIPLKEYIDKDNSNDLKEFFYNNVIHMDKDLSWNNSNIDKLKYIKISSLKAILSTKLIKALSLNIDIRVDIVEHICRVNMNIMDLCRIIGILMDNAIEASTKCEKPKICLCVFNKGDYVAIVINNNFSGEKPVIHKIYKEGFSTKGEKRGLGLYNVKNIIDTKYPNVCINTSTEGDLFIQELWIKHSEDSSSIF